MLSDSVSTLHSSLIVMVDWLIDLVLNTVSAVFYPFNGSSLQMTCSVATTIEITTTIEIIISIVVENEFQT